VHILECLKSILGQQNKNRKIKEKNKDHDTLPFHELKFVIFLKLRYNFIIIFETHEKYCDKSYIV